VSQDSCNRSNDLTIVCACVYIYVRVFVPVFINLCVGYDEKKWTHLLNISFEIEVASVSTWHDLLSTCSRNMPLVVDDDTGMSIVRDDHTFWLHSDTF
jgi:hypothetical protein